MGRNSKYPMGDEIFEHIILEHEINNLPLSCIERKVLKSIDYDDIVDTLAISKIQKITI
jgi:hypothetical protein